MTRDDGLRTEPGYSPVLGTLVVIATWLCSFLGPVFVIYGMRHNNTLTHYETVGCALISLPPTFIIAALLGLAGRL